MNKILRNSIIVAIVLGTVGTSSFYNYTYAKGDGAVEEGDGAKADGENSVAIGSEANAKWYNSVAIGHEAIAQSSDSVAIGKQASATASSSVALGEESHAKGGCSVALGINSYALGDDVVAVGLNATAKGWSSIAIGDTSVADGDSSLAVGRNATALKDFSLALGKSASAFSQNSVAIGYGSKANDEYEFSVGKDESVGYGDYYPKEAIYRRITHVADGVKDHDAVTVEQLNSAKLHYIDLNFEGIVATDNEGKIRKDINFNNDGAKSTGSIAIGFGAKTDAPSKNYKYEDYADGQYQIAMGFDAEAYGESSVSLGYKTFSNSFGISVGNGAHSDIGGVSIGAGAGAGDKMIKGRQGAVIIGSGANAQFAGSVALGLAALANRNAVTTEGGKKAAFLGDAESVRNTFIQGKKIAKFNDLYATNVNAAVSIGRVDDSEYKHTRQLTGLAAGTEDTDAVNVAQAKALVSGEIDETNTTRSVTGAKIKAALDQKMDKSALDGYAKTTDLATKANVSDLDAYAKNTDLNAYAKNTELAKKADTNASNLTKAEDILAWQKKLGLADNSATVTPGSTATTTNLYTTVNNMNTTVNQLKAGYTVKAGTDTFDMKLGDTTAPTIEFAGDSTNGLDVAADKAGKKITYAINKDKLVKSIAGDLIKQMNGEGTPGSGDHGTPGSGNPSGHGTGEQGQTTPLPVLTNVSTGFNIAVGNDSKNFTFGKGKETNKLTFAGTNDETSVSISGEDGTPTITVGLADTFKTKVNNKADKTTVNTLQRLVSLNTENVAKKADKDELTKLETKITNITNGTTKIDVTNIDLSTNNTFKELKTSVEGKADTNATNLTKAEDILAWQKKLGIADNSATVTPGSTAPTTNLFTTVNQLKAGYTVKAGTNTFDMKLGDTTVPTIEFAGDGTNGLDVAADKAGKKITYAINKEKLVKYIAGDLIKQMNGEGTPGSGNPSEHGTGEQGQTTPLPVLTNVSTGFNIAVGTDSKNFTFGKGKETNKLTFAGTNDETSVSISGEDGTPTITVGLADTFKTKVNNKADKTTVNTLQRLVSLNTENVAQKADKDELTKLETKINNITNGTTNIDGSKINLTTNNTFTTLQNTVNGKADTNANNLTKAEDILAWQKKLGLADNSATVTPGSTAPTTNLYTTVNNMNTTVNQLKAGYTVKAGTETFDMKLGDTAAPTIEFAGDSTNGLDVAADKAGKKITYAINKEKLVKYIAGDLIKQMNGEGIPGSGNPSEHGTGEQGQTTPLPVLTNVSTGFNIAVGTDSKNFTFGKGKETNKLTFAGTNDETSVSISGEDGTPTVTVGLADTFKTKVNNKADKSELSSYAKNSALTELETKVNNITNGTTNIDGSKINLTTNNTFTTLQNTVNGKADTNANNLTKAEDILAWQKKLGIADNSTTVTPGSTATTNLYTTVNNMNTTVNQLKAGYTVKVGTNTFDMKLGDTTAPTIEFAGDSTNGLDVAADKAGKKITYAINKEKLVKYIAGDLIKQMNGESIPGSGNPSGQGTGEQGQTTPLPVLTNVSTGFNIAVGDNSKNFTFGKGKETNKLTFAGTNDETSVSISGEDGTPTITVGLADTFKTKVNNKADKTTVNTLQRLVSLNTDNVAKKADKDELTKLETKVNNITNGTTQIDGSKINLTTNNTFTTLQTSVEGKADTNANNLTKAEDILAWQKKLGIADNSTTVTPGSTATTTNLYTTVNNMNTTVNQLKAGYTVKAGTETFDMKLGDTAAPTIEFAGDSTNGLEVAADKAGKKITYAINKDKLVKYIAGDLIKQMNGEGTPGSGNPSEHGTGEQGQTTPLPVLTNVSTGFNIAVGTDSKNFTFGKGKETNKLTFAGTNDETSVSISGEDGTPTITVGLADTFKTKVNNKADKTTVNTLQRLVSLNTDNVAKKADKDAGNLTDMDISQWRGKLGGGTVTENNNGLVTGGTVHTALQDKADKTAENIEVLAWKKKLGLVDAQATQDSTTNISTQVTNISSDITNLKGGFIVSDGTKSKEITLGGTTKDKLTFASADKNLTATFNETNKTVSYGVNVANLIGDINKSDTKITNVDLTNNQTITNLKTEIQNITGGSGTTGSLSTKADTNATNLTKAEDILAWQKKLGIADNSATVTPGSTATTTNLYTTVNNMNTTVNQLKAGYTVKAGTETFDMKLGDTKAPTIEFAGDSTNGLDVAADKEGKKITYTFNKGNLVKSIAGDLIKQMNGENTPGSGNPSGQGTGEQGQTTPLPVLTNVSTGFNIAVGTDSKNFTFGKGKETNKLTFAGTNDETSVSISGEDGTPTITVGLADTFKTKVNNKADKTTVNTLQRLVSLNTDNVAKKADKDAGNLTDMDISQWRGKLGGGTVTENNNGLVTGGTVHTALQDKADKTAENIEVLAWKKKLGLVDAQATQDSTTNISTQVTNISSDITNLKGGFIVSDGTKSKEIILGGTTKDKLTFASADKNLTATFDDAKKTISYGVNVANLIGDINKSDTKITNVDLTNNQTITNLKTEIQNITGGGSGTAGILANKANKNASNITVSDWATTLGTGEVATGNANLVTGGKVFDALSAYAKTTDLATKANTSDLDAYAKKDATNITGESLTKWQSALGNGTIAENNKGLVTGGTVYTALKGKADKNAENIEVLAWKKKLGLVDAQATQDTANISTELSKIKNGFKISDGTNSSSIVWGTTAPVMTFKGTNGITASVNNTEITFKMDWAADSVPKFHIYQAQGESSAVGRRRRARSVEDTPNVPGTLIGSMGLNQLNMVFGKGLKAETNGSYTVISLAENTGMSKFTVKTDEKDKTTQKEKTFDVESGDSKAQLNVVGDGKNISTSIEKNNTVKVSLKDDVSIKSLTATTITTDTVKLGTVKGKEKVYLDEKGIHANDQVISDVKAGEKDSDAVNVAQLKALAGHTDKIGRVVGKLAIESRNGDALNAALSALRPLDYDPESKFDVSAGYGTYKGVHAMAVGTFYRPNATTLFSIGGSFTGGDSMMNAGVSFKVGPGSGSQTYLSRQAIASMLKRFSVEHEAMKNVLAEQDARTQAQIEALQKENSSLKDKVNRLEKENNDRIEKANNRIAELERQVKEVLINLKK